MYYVRIKDKEGHRHYPKPLVRVAATFDRACDMAIEFNGEVVNRLGEVQYVPKIDISSGEDCMNKECV